MHIGRAPHLFRRAVAQIGHWVRGNKRVVVVATAHKVGSTWLYDMAKELGCYRVLHPPSQLTETGTVKLDESAFYEYLSRLRGAFITKSHSFPPNPEHLAGIKDNLRLVTMLRDPRDVIVSSSFYLARLEPSLGGWGPEFASLPEKQQMLEVIARGDFLLDRLEAWAFTDCAFRTRYEDLLENPVEVLRALAQYLDIDASNSRIHRIVQRNSFVRVTGRRPGTSANAFRRKGISGDWKNYFDEEVVERFQFPHDGRWNKLLAELRYE